LFLYDRGWFYVIWSCFEIEVDVGLYTADLVIRLALEDVNSVVDSSVLNIDGVSFVESCIVG
jgi:hypothetical protein